MKSSLEMLRRRQTSSHLGTIWSTHCCGGMPSSAEARATFRLCSSVPVRKKTGSPFSRWYLATKSHATIS